MRLWLHAADKFGIFDASAPGNGLFHEPHASISRIVVNGVNNSVDKGIGRLYPTPMNSYTNFPTDEWDASLGKEPTSSGYRPGPVNKHYKRAPGDLIALIDRQVDAMVAEGIRSRADLAQRQKEAGI